MNTIEMISKITENHNRIFEDIFGQRVKWEDDCIKWENGPLELNTITLNMEWNETCEPVTFNDVILSNKKCKVEHILISIKIKDSISSKDSVTNFDFENLKSGKFMYFSSLMGILPWILTSADLKEVMVNGRWYLED